jgi:hypothetical protein
MEGLRTAPATGFADTVHRRRGRCFLRRCRCEFGGFARRPMGKPLSRQVERDTDRDAAQRRMVRVESIRALVQVLDGSSDMARFVESLRGDSVCQENAGNRDQNQERDCQSDVTLAIQAVRSGKGAV